MSERLTRIVMLKERVGGEMILVVSPEKAVGNLVKQGTVS